MTHDDLPCAAPCLGRRSILGVAGVAGAAGVTALLTGCQTYGAEPAAAPPATRPAGTQPAGSQAAGTQPASTQPAGSQAGGAAAGGTPPSRPPALAQLGDIPVGGGKIFADQNVVITQPEPGRVRAFSAVCTHAGCTVGEVSDGTIACPCHGSRFRLTDGSVAAGPATSPLPAVAITTQGDAIRLA